MTLDIGTRITHDNYTDLTPGTVVDYNGRTYRVLGNGYALPPRAHGGQPHSTYFFADWGGCRVTEVGTEPVNEMTPGQFKQRLRTVTFGASVRAGIEMPPVRAALRALGCDETPPLGVGMWVHASDHDLMERLNREDVLFVVGNPNWWKGFGVFNHRQRHVDGGLSQWPETVQVAKMNNPETDMYLTVPTEADREVVARLRGQAWAIGEQAKRDNSWCASFEGAMATLGLSGTSVQVTAEVPPEPAPEPNAAPGRVIDMGAQRALPEGAILMWPTDGVIDSERSWCVLRRGGTSAHYPTEYLFGPNTGRGSHELRVLWDGTGEMSIPVTDPVMMDAAPIGSQVQSGGSGVFTKSEQGWSVGNMRIFHNGEAFFANGVSQYRFIRFGPEVDDIVF